MAGIAASRTDPTSDAVSWSERLLAFAERSHARACAALLALALVCFLPGIASLQPMDRDEPRFAQATKQMLETGDFVDIRFQDEARYKKPIGIHWLQAASVRAGEALGIPAARTTIGLYRVPSLLGALAAVLLTYWAALAFAGRREAFVAAALMGSCVILMVEARLAKTDAVLLATCAAAMGALGRAYLGRHGARQPVSTAIVFWLAVALGILIKGPLVVLFAGLPALVLSVRERSAVWLRALRPGLGLLFVLVAILPWFVAIWIKSGGAFYRLAVGDDMLGKVTTGQQQHGAPPGFYLVAFFATFFPGAILAAIAAPFVWTSRREDWAAFALAWIVPAWVLFEAFPTKLPHYVMPLYPMIAIASVIAMTRRYVGPQRPGARVAFAAMPLIPIGLTIGLGYAAWTLDGALPASALPVLLAACAVALAAWLSFGRREVTRATLTGIASAALLSVAVFGLVQPVLRSLKMSPRLAETVARSGCATPVVATLGYREPSLVFLAGTDLAMIERPDQAAAFLNAPGCRVLFVADRFAEGVAPALAAVEPRPEALGRVEGFNINGGRRVGVDAFVVRH